MKEAVMRCEDVRKLLVIQKEELENVKEAVACLFAEVRLLNDDLEKSIRFLENKIAEGAETE